jgi:hypothetical protein
VQPEQPRESLEHSQVVIDDQNQVSALHDIPEWSGDMPVRAAGARLLRRCI